MWVTFADGRVIGEGINTSGTGYFEAVYIRVNFDNGNWFTNVFAETITQPDITLVIVP